MRILMINSVAASGSTAMICRTLSEKLCAHGVEVVIAYGRGADAPEFETHRIGSDADVYAHGLRTRLLDAHGFGSRRATEKFVKWMEDFNPDLIHLHNIHGYYLHIDVLFRALQKMNKPIIWTLHDCWAFTGHCAHFSSIGCDKWLSGCHHCGLKGNYPASLLRDRSAQNYQMKKQLFTLPRNMTLVAPSAWLAGEVNRSFMGNYPVRTIYHGINTAVFHPAPSHIREEHGLAGKKIALAVASVWNESKGLPEMLSLAEYLGQNWQVVLVGQLPGRMPPIPANVTCVPKTEDTSVLAAWYCAADVFVNPTHGDTFPTTNLEAQACGTPVVTFPAGGSPEGVYPPLRQELVCPDFTVQSLGRCVCRAACFSPVQRQKIAAWTAESFASDVFAEVYYRLYQSLL